MDESAFESESLSDPFSSLSDSILGFFLLRRLTPDSTAIWKSRQEVESRPNISKQRGRGSKVWSRRDSAGRCHKFMAENRASYDTYLCKLAHLSNLALYSQYCSREGSC